MITLSIVIISVVAVIGSGFILDEWWFNREIKNIVISAQKRERYLKMSETEIDIWPERAQNVRYHPKEDSVWVFNDTENEKTPIEWKVTGIDLEKGVTTVTKMTGADTGYTREYQLELFFSAVWHPKTLEDTEKEVTSPCPACDKLNEIPADDYICEECRANG